MIPSVSLNLLTQDNSIPGNRKDGFRFHHLLFLIVSTPIYLWFELSFGVSLLDVMGSNVVIDDTRVVEHWGRLISGAAVALLLLSAWIRQCEREAVPLLRNIAVGVVIVLFALVSTWKAQGKILDFYVERTSAEIPWAVSSLAVVLAGGFYLARAALVSRLHHLRQAGRRKLVAALLAGLAILLGYAQLQLLDSRHPDRARELGVERQRTATLTIIRRGLQEGIYQLPAGALAPADLHSPEGHAYLALFPIFGTVFDMRRFEADRPRLIAEFMYRDWQRDFGGQAYAAYAEANAGIKQRFDVARQSGARSLRLGERDVPLTLTPDALARHPAVEKYLRQELGCFDCAFRLDMSRESFGREYYKWSKANDVRQAIETFASPENFETGRNGDRAARTYWAPILALLFSMLGAFTHVFKLLVTLTAYFHRASFDRIDAADSMLADEVIKNSTRVTAGAVIALALFAYFVENRITGEADYPAQHAVLWAEKPIAGAIAGHWTVNVQGLIYPFTKKMRPAWLDFQNDPLANIPILGEHLANRDIE